MNPSNFVFKNFERLQADAERIESEFANGSDNPATCVQYQTLLGATDLLAKNEQDIYQLSCKLVIGASENGTISDLELSCGAIAMAGSQLFDVGNSSPTLSPGDKLILEDPQSLSSILTESMPLSCVTNNLGMSTMSLISTSSSSAPTVASLHSSSVTTNESIVAGNGIKAARSIAANRSTEANGADSESSLDLKEYLDCKCTHAHIMKDFTDHRICFIGHDGHDIYQAEYQNIAIQVKLGDDHARYMQGETKTFKTSYNKKTNSFTENTLFTPKYRYCDGHPQSPRRARKTRSSYSITSVNTSSTAGAETSTCGAFNTNYGFPPKLLTESSIYSSTSGDTSVYSSFSISAWASEKSEGAGGSYMTPSSVFEAGAYGFSPSAVLHYDKDPGTTTQTILAAAPIVRTTSHESGPEGGSDGKKSNSSSPKSQGAGCTGSSADTRSCEIVGTSIAPSSRSSFSALPSSAGNRRKSSLPPLELKEYEECKAKLASINRDFTDKKIFFIARDGHNIRMTEYRGIAAAVKNGEHYESYMQGETKKFKTGYNSKSGTFTETARFVPIFRHRPREPIDSVEKVTKAPIPRWK